MIRDYVGHVLVDNEIKKIPFKTDDSPVKYLWGRFGMAIYIEKIEGVENTEMGEETDGPEGGDK